jgi:hypothetical protein
MMDRCRELDAADELCLRGRQVDQGEIAGGKRVAMSLFAIDRPHLRPEKRSRPLSVSLGEVEQIMRHLRTVPWVFEASEGAGQSSKVPTRHSTRRSQPGDLDRPPGTL